MDTTASERKDLRTSCKKRSLDCRNCGKGLKHSRGSCRKVDDPPSYLSKNSKPIKL